MKNKISRKKFLKNSLIGLGAATTLSRCTTDSSSSESPNIQTDKNYKWRLLTTWPPNFPVLGEGCNLFADWVREMSRGQLDITVFGGGELVPALETFDAVSSGTAEMGHGASYYWAGKVPAAQFFCTMPFGMNAQQQTAWVLQGGGYKLYRELYAKHNLHPIVAGNTGVQMGGWFNKEINTIDDFRGLVMRMPGFGGKVISEAGATAQLVAGGEIYTNLERGVIDATEWIGPYHDYKMGFHEIAKYYYAPGWHEPGPILELFIDKRKFDKLPSHLKTIIEVAAHSLNQWMLLEFEAKNDLYLNKLINEEDVQLKFFSDDILNGLRKHTDDIISDMISADPDSAKIYSSLSKFKHGIKAWSDISEKLYYNKLQI